MPWHSLAPPAIPWHRHPCHVLQLPDLDDASPLPPYRQVAAILAAAIRAGDYQPGDRLPSIVDLGQRYGLARRTASKALGLVVEQGLAVYSPGWGHFARGTLPGHAIE
jgi:DNA-binding GntR family transcriptional regulator